MTLYIHTQYILGMRARLVEDKGEAVQGISCGKEGGKEVYKSIIK